MDVSVIREIIRNIMTEILYLFTHLKDVTTKKKLREGSLRVLSAAHNHYTTLLRIVQNIKINAILGTDVHKLL